MALNHSRECSDSSEGCAECVLKILADLKHAYETRTLKSFYDSNVNLYRWNMFDVNDGVVKLAIKFLYSLEKNCI